MAVGYFGKGTEIGCSDGLDYFPKVLIEPIPAPRSAGLVGSLILIFIKLRKAKKYIPVFVND